MTIMTAGGRVPEFTLGWRMRLALETGEVSVNEMAKALGYSRSTISRWLNDIDEPRPVILDAWARETGSDRAWLETGEPGPTSPGPGTPASDKLARLTEAKQRRARRSPTTRRYLTREPVPAVAA